MHVPVMLQETLDCLAVRPGGVYLDATLGRAGHAAEILRQAGATGRLLGIDRDLAALRRAQTALREVPGTAVCVHGNHGDLGSIADANGFSELDGVLIDMGVSSDQLDTSERGFSFQQNGPLDMRMDPTRGETAADLIARLDVETLAEQFHTLGEEPQAGRIARAIIREREQVQIETTGQLAAIVLRAVGGRRDRARHPATRVFQALRMAVNGELEALTGALDGALARLRPEGRVVVITFESLSDRIVKQCFTEHVGREVSLQQGGSRWEGQRPQMAWVQRKALRPTPAEIEQNPRARSAKLRAVRLPTESERLNPFAVKNRAAPTGANDNHTHLEDE